MKYYKNTTNEIFGIEQGQENLVQNGWTEITEDEMLVITNPPKTPEQIVAEKIIEYKLYLKDTDFYYARLLETNEAVPLDVVTKRAEAREFIRSNQG